MFFETLEHRKLFSVYVVHVGCAPGESTNNSAVVADQKLIDAAQVQLQKDDCTFDKTLSSDVKAMLCDGLRKDATLMPLFQQLQVDTKSMGLNLKADAQAAHAVMSQDEKAINSEEMQVCKDKHNPTALKTDQTALLAGRIQLQNDEITALDTRLATLQTDENTIANDLGAINGALTGDTTASPQLVAGAGKFRNDTLAAFNGTASDLLALIGARAQLVGDLTAMQTSSQAFP